MPGDLTFIDDFLLPALQTGGLIKQGQNLSDLGDADMEAMAQHYQTALEDYAPYRDHGETSIADERGELQLDNEPYGGVLSSPGYDFRFEEGMRGLKNDLAARGRSKSGAAVRRAARFGAGLAAEDYGQQYNYKQRLTNIGRGASENLGAFGMNSAQGQAGILQNQGANQADFWSTIGRSGGDWISNILGGI